MLQDSNNQSENNFAYGTVKAESGLYTCKLLEKSLCDEGITVVHASTSSERLSQKKIDLRNQFVEKQKQDKPMLSRQETLEVDGRQGGIPIVKTELSPSSLDT